MAVKRTKADHVSKFELVSCPFCKSDKVGIRDEQKELPRYLGECRRCGALGPEMPTIWRATNAWNRRPLAPNSEQKTTKLSKSKGIN